MSKAQNQDTRAQAMNMNAYTDSEVHKAMAGFGSQQQVSGAEADTAFGSAYGGFNQGQQTGFYDPARLTADYGMTADSAATGGYDPTAASNLTKSMTDYTSTGGYNAKTLSDLMNQEDQFTSSGGMDEDAASAVKGGYTSLATTGGFTPKEESQFIEQATQGVHGTYDTLANQAALARNKTGGLGGGGDAVTMARQAAQAQADATLAAETGLHTAKQQGIQAGLTGLEGSQKDLAGLRQQALTQKATTASDEAHGTMQGLGQQSAFQQAQAQGKQKGVDQALSLDKDVAGNKATAAQGMAKLFTDASGNLTAQGDQILKALGISVTSQGQLDQVLAGLASNTKGPLSDSLQILNAIMGTASGAKALAT